jgi:tRNA uridine 5-carboxymethylaminomethyl modification enzyme
MNTKINLDTFDVIIVGGGHAGIEAAYASARMGQSTALITLKPTGVGQMFCNPAVGGIGKGHIVFEISALGGIMPELCTKSYLQARMLNTKKGPAVQGLRLQIDKVAYNKAAYEKLSVTKNLTIIGDMVEELIIEEPTHIKGVKTRSGKIYYAPSVVLTTGTFLTAVTHHGLVTASSGPQGEEAVDKLTPQLKNLGLSMGRLKTGTPARLLRSSIDFSSMEVQGSDPLEALFEFAPHKVEHKMDCYLTYTNEKTHEIIKNNFHLSPIFTGNIKGTAPRYCPSIEDKVCRFADKNSHHVFVEPESASNEEIYPNGISTSLPQEIQELFIRSIKGFEKAEFVRAGYAIEYDYVFPNQLKHSLEVATISGLFLAGQINGTTGYEEAAGQGILAGINAALKSQKKEPFTLDRTISYIGIMVDDLVTLGVDEPYRMFTSRAERRLILRQDNVFSRLGQQAYDLGLIDTLLYTSIQEERSLIEESFNQLNFGKSAIELAQNIGLGNTEFVREKIMATLKPEERKERIYQSIYAEILYGPYLKREQKEVEKLQQFQNLVIPARIDYSQIPGLSIELQQKLKKYAPKTIAQATLIQGMTPAALSLLIFVAKKETLHFQEKAE